MAEAAEPKALIEPVNWKEFLEKFAVRNYNRRARFDVFRTNGSVDEEGIEAHLEDISLKVIDGSRKIEVIRIDRSESKAEKLKDTIENVIGVAVQYDTDGSEDALEVIDRENSLIRLRLESKVDGAS